MKITIITDTPVWSLGKNQGAPSFYKTLKLYNDKEDDVTFITTEKNVDISELQNVTVYILPKLPVIRSHFFFGLFRLINKHLNYIVEQIVGFFFLCRLSRHSSIIYAYEIGYVPCTRWFTLLFNKKLVTRFQGSVLTDLVNNKVTLFNKFLLGLQFLDQIWALRTNTDLLIMTDDGTKGKSIVNLLNQSDKPIWFVRNGVDLPSNEDLEKLNKTKKIINRETIYFTSASRLQNWKRLDRSILIFAEVLKYHPNCIYTICGDGPALQSCLSLINNLGISEKVKLLGAVDKNTIYETLLHSDFFLSSYELSNLGNPLFEAICCDNVIVTLSNGDTSELIVDGYTGIISGEKDYIMNANKIIQLIGNLEKQKEIKVKAKQKLINQFSNWSIRMENEYNKVSSLLNNK